MVCLLVLVVAYVVSIQAVIQYDKETLARHAQHREACLKKTHLDQALLAAAADEGIMDDPMVQQHVYCMSQEFGFQDKDGKLIFPTIEAGTNRILQNETFTHDLIEKCIPKSGSPVEVAVHSFRCYFEEAGIVML